MSVSSDDLRYIFLLFSRVIKGYRRPVGAFSNRMKYPDDSPPDKVSQQRMSEVEELILICQRFARTGTLSFYVYVKFWTFRNGNREWHIYLLYSAEEYHH